MKIKKKKKIANWIHIWKVKRQSVNIISKHERIDIYYLRMNEEAICGNWGSTVQYNATHSTNPKHSTDKTQLWRENTHISYHAVLLNLLISCSLHHFLQYGISSNHLNNGCATQWTFSSSTYQLMCAFRACAHVPTSVCV